MRRLIILVMSNILLTGCTSAEDLRESREAYEALKSSCINEHYEESKITSYTLIQEHQKQDLYHITLDSGKTFHIISGESTSGDFNGTIDGYNNYIVNLEVDGVFMSNKSETIKYEVGDTIQVSTKDIFNKRDNSSSVGYSCSRDVIQSLQKITRVGDDN